MTIVVEDGTGLSSAESYVSVADLEAYWSARADATVAAAAEAAQEAALRKATAYIDTIARYKGVQLAEGQALEFPRDGLVDWSGRAVSGLPKRLKDACCELAFKVIGGEELYVDLDRGGKVASESVGPISVSYAYDAPAGKTFRAAMQLLQPYIRDVRESFAPYMGGAAGQPSTVEPATSLTPIFDVGMHSNTSSD